MNWQQTVEKWRQLPAAEKRRRRRLAIPANVARTMSFEGEPVTQHTIEEIARRLGIPGC